MVNEVIGEKRQEDQLVIAAQYTRDAINSFFLKEIFPMDSQKSLRSHIAVMFVKGTLFSKREISRANLLTDLQTFLTLTAQNGVIFVEEEEQI